MQSYHLSAKPQELMRNQTIVLILENCIIGPSVLRADCCLDGICWPLDDMMTCV